MANFLSQTFHSGKNVVSGQDLTNLVNAINAIAAQTEVVSTPLNTVGAGTILAAAISGGLVTRGGTQTAAFTDTTDTAAHIIAANPGITPRVGSSFEFQYVNNTIWPATITGGTGVTASAVVPANSWAKFLVTYSAANTVVFTLIEQGYFPHSGTFVANGVTPVVVANANVTASSSIIITLQTVGGTVSPSVPYINTITPGTGFHVTGSASDTSTYSYTILG
jgi:hypothetical protein